MKAEPEVETYASETNSRSQPSSSGAARSFKRHAVNITLIVLAIVALFWRVFFLGETLIDVNTLNNQLPWGYAAGQSDYPYNRRDLTDTYVTRDYFVASAYRDGEFPLWNPYTMAGHPIYADGVTRTLSPFLLFYKFLDVPLGYSVARITELMLAAVFMYVFLLAIGTSASGALMGSLVFGFSAHSMLHLTGLGWWGGLMWLPLILLFAGRAIKRESCVQATLAGVFLAVQFFCGYLPNQIYYVGAVILYYLFFARGSENRSVRRALAMTAVTLAVGFALSATQWVPSLELLSYSNRKIVGAELGYVYLPPWYAATLVFPNLFGAAYDAKTLNLFTAIGVSHDHILYLGIAALAPMGFGLYWLRMTGKKRQGVDVLQPSIADAAARDHMVFFAGLAALSLIIMMAAPLYVPVTRYIPVLQVIRVAVRGGVLFLIAASVLAAFGTDLLSTAGADVLKHFTRLARRFAFVVASFVVLAMIGSYVMALTGFAADTAERGRVAFIRRAALTLGAQFTPPKTNILIPLVFLLTAVVLLWALGKRRLASKSFVACLAALLMIDLFWNSRQFDHSFDRSRVFPRTEITDVLRSLPSGRVLVVPSDLETNRRVTSEPGTQKIIAPPNTLLPYQIPTVTGKNQQFPRWYRELASLIEPQRNLSHVVFDQYRSPFFDLLNVRYVMTRESWPRLDGYGLLASAEGVSLYENTNAMPRAFFIDHLIEVENHADALNALSDSGFDPRSTAVVEVTKTAKASGERIVDAQLPADNSTRHETSLASMSLPHALPIATIVEDKRNQVTIHTDNGTDGLLVLSDNYYPGWRAFLDGSPTGILRANCAMRAVNVPAGRHVLSFVFGPPAFFMSMYISLAAAALTLVALVIAATKRKPAKQATGQ